MPSASAAEAIVTAAGGLAALTGAALNPFGIERTSKPRTGDVGVIHVLGPDGPADVSAICCGARWAARSERGLWIGLAPLVEAWRI